MKHLALFILLIIPAISFGQKKLLSYVASNRIEYARGDTLDLGTATNVTQREFSFMHYAPTFSAFMEGDMSYLPAHFSGQMLIIKKIKKIKSKKRGDKVYLIGGMGLVSNIWVDIESALETGEVINPNAIDDHLAPSTISVADELIKLKSLLDQEAITQAEYDTMKKKLISEY